MKIEKIYLNYCVIGRFNNHLYIFYKKFKNDKINYKKISKINLLDSMDYYKIYDIFTKKNIFKNVNCNRRIYSSTNQIEVLVLMAEKIIKKSFHLQFYL